VPQWGRNRQRWVGNARARFGSDRSTLDSFVIFRWECVVHAAWRSSHAGVRLSMNSFRLSDSYGGGGGEKRLVPVGFIPNPVYLCILYAFDADAVYYIYV